MKKLLVIFLLATLPILMSTMIPKSMGIEFYPENGRYVSKTFHLPLKIKDAQLSLTLSLNTYCEILLEIHIGENYFTYNLNRHTIDYHLSLNVGEYISSLANNDVSMVLTIDSDGIVTELPYLFLTYYGF